MEIVKTSEIKVESNLTGQKKSQGNLNFTMMCVNVSNTLKEVHTTNYNENPMKVHIKHFTQCLAYSLNYYHGITVKQQ